MRLGRLIADSTSARRWASALLALALALLVGFSGISSASHAHAAAPAAEAASSHAHMSVGEMPGHSAPCMDRNCGDEGDQGGCCKWSTSCGVCAPVPSAMLQMSWSGPHRVSTKSPASSPGEWTVPSRPPKPAPIA